MEVQEEQPTTEMEVTTDVTQENQPEKPAQTEETKLDNLMKIMVEMNKKMDDNNKELKEDLGKR